LTNINIFYYTLKRIWWLFWQFVRFGYVYIKKLKTNIKHIVKFKYFFKNFILFDFFLVLFYKFLFNLLIFKKNRALLRYKQFANKVYNKVYIPSTFNFKFSGLIYFWKNFRYWLLGVVLASVTVYYFLVIRSLPFNKIMFEWFLVTMLFYWFISGFVFFIKKYRFSKFTTAIQRFWRRTFTIFWLLESFLFLIFIYLTINANQESVYMYDSMQIYKTHLFSWRLFILKIFPIALLIIFSYFFLLMMKWNIFSKNNIFFFFITLLLVYIVWLEFYQFFHVLSYYGNLFWAYDAEEHLWFLESEYRRTRIANHYITICIVAKFWHLIFIFIFWVFFLLRGNELLRYRYPLFSTNFYNFIFLYILSWVYMYPWYKFLVRRHMSSVYYWFFVNPRHLFFRILFNDVKLVYFGLLNFFKNFFSTNFIFLQSDFYYFISNSHLTNYCQYKKHFIRDLLLYNLH
jgi:hypothetical protein